MNFLGTRVHDPRSKSWGQIVGVVRRGNVLEHFRIELDSGHVVNRTRADLFVKDKRKQLRLRLVHSQDKQDLDA